MKVVVLLLCVILTQAHLLYASQIGVATEIRFGKQSVRPVTFTGNATAPFRAVVEERMDSVQDLHFALNLFFQDEPLLWSRLVPVSIYTSWYAREIVFLIWSALSNSTDQVATAVWLAPPYTVDNTNAHGNGKPLWVYETDKDAPSWNNGIQVWTC